jgi:hypothetical protein
VFLYLVLQKELYNRFGIFQMRIFVIIAVPFVYGIWFQ